MIYDKPLYVKDPITGKIIPTCSEPLFTDAGVLPIQNRAKLRTASLVYKSLNGEAPEYISDMFHLNTNIRRTRNSIENGLYVPKTMLCVTRRSLAFNGAMICNSLPDNIRGVDSLTAFKTGSYKYYMENYPVS